MYPLKTKSDLLIPSGIVVTTPDKFRFYSISIFIYTLSLTPLVTVTTFRSFETHHVPICMYNAPLFSVCVFSIKRNIVLAHRIRLSENLPWNRKSYLTHAILPRTSSNVVVCLFVCLI